jgi:hypothetical protein
VDPWSVQRLAKALDTTPALLLQQFTPEKPYLGLLWSDGPEFNTRTGPAGTDHDVREFQPGTGNAVRGKNRIAKRGKVSFASVIFAEPPNALLKLRAPVTKEERDPDLGPSFADLLLGAPRG